MLITITNLSPVSIDIAGFSTILILKCSLNFLQTVNKVFCYLCSHLINCDRTTFDSSITKQSFVNDSLCLFQSLQITLTENIRFLHHFFHNTFT